VRWRLEKFGFCIRKQALAAAAAAAAVQQPQQLLEILRVAVASCKAKRLIGHDGADGEPDDHRLSLGLDVLCGAAKKSKLAQSFVDFHEVAVALGAQALGDDYVAHNEMVILSFPGGKDQVREWGGGESSRRAFFLLHHSLSALRLCQCKHTDNDPSKTEGRPTYSMFYTLAGTGRLRVWLPESDEKVEITYEPLDLLIIDANKLVHAGVGG
jgi:hypothetical protein